MNCKSLLSLCSSNSKKDYADEGPYYPKIEFVTPGKTSLVFSKILFVLGQTLHETLSLVPLVFVSTVQIFPAVINDFLFHLYLFPNKSLNLGSNNSLVVTCGETEK